MKGYSNQAQRVSEENQLNFDVRRELALLGFEAGKMNKEKNSSYSDEFFITNFNEALHEINKRHVFWMYNLDMRL